MLVLPEIPFEMVTFEKLEGLLDCVIRIISMIADETEKGRFV